MFGAGVLETDELEVGVLETDELEVGVFEVDAALFAHV